MKNPLDSDYAGDLGLLLPRVALGAVFALAGVSKVHKLGVGKFAAGAMASAVKFMPDWCANAFLHLLPFAEILVGVMLVLGLFTRVAGFVAALMLLSFMVAVTGAWESGKFALHMNVVHIAIALLALLVGPGSISVDSLWSKSSAPAPKD